MDWLVNHKGDFEVKAKQVLGQQVKIKWDNPKMIVVAKEFDRYDKYAVNQIKYDIYLYKYMYYENDELYLENINVAENKKYYINNSSSDTSTTSEKYIRKEYDFNYHLDKGNDNIQALLNELNEEILNISDQIEVRYPQLYIAYRTTRNFAEVHINKNNIIVYLMTIDYDDPENKIENVPESYQWVLNKRIYINNEEDLKYAMKLIIKSYESTL
jgi:predicted transport protein